jgi:Na+/glutamate symporter
MNLIEGRPNMQLLMPFWQRLLITIVVMLVVSYVVGWIWQWILGFALPSYVGGLVGGLSALPAWDFLKRIRPSQKS